MTAARTLSPDIAACEVHSAHSPVPLTLQEHHVIPESWTTVLGLGPGHLVVVCPTGHDAIHVLIRRKVLDQPESARESHSYGTYRPWVDQAVAFWNAHPELAKLVRW